MYSLNVFLPPRSKVWCPKFPEISILYLLDAIGFCFSLGLFHFEKKSQLQEIEWGRMAGPSRNQFDSGWQWLITAAYNQK